MSSIALRESTSNHAKSALSPDDKTILMNELHQRIAQQITTMNRDWLEYRGSIPLDRVRGALAFLKDQKFDWPVEELLQVIHGANENQDFEMAAALAQFGLFNAVSRGDPEAIELLLESGAADETGIQEAVQLARVTKQWEIMMRLRQFIYPPFPPEVMTHIARYCDDQAIVALSNSSFSIESALQSKWGDKTIIDPYTKKIRQENMVSEARTRRLKNAAATVYKNMNLDDMAWLESKRKALGAKTIAETVQAGLEFMKEQGYELSSRDFRHQVAKSLKNQDIETAQVLINFWFTTEPRADAALIQICANSEPTVLQLVLQNEHVTLGMARKYLGHISTVPGKINVMQVLADSTLLTKWYATITEQPEWYWAVDWNPVTSAARSTDLLLIAALKGDQKNAELLLECHPLTDTGKRKTLEIAAYTGNTKLVELLLKNSFKHYEIEQARDTASEEGQQQVCALLDNYAKQCGPYPLGTFKTDGW